MVVLVSKYFFEGYVAFGVYESHGFFSLNQKGKINLMYLMLRIKY